MNKRIGFIGCGNMGTAMIAGILDSGKCEPQEMMVSCRTKAALEKKKEEYGDILVMVSEIAYFLQNELGCGFPAYGIPQSGEFDF